MKVISKEFVFDHSVQNIFKIKNIDCHNIHIYVYIIIFFSIEHNMKGKQGTIDIQVGNPERVHKDKSGHLLIVSFDYNYFY